MATDRRRFFASGLVAATGLAACSKKKAPSGSTVAAASPAGPLHVFVVENGTLGQAGFSVGLLATRDPAARVLSLATIRRQTRFRTDLSFASTNRWKLKYLEPAFRHLAETADLRPRMVAATGFAGWDRQTEAKQLSTWLAIYHRLFEGIPAGERAGMVVHLTRRSTGGNRDTRLVSDLRATLGQGVMVSLDGARFKDLMELAAVVFGSVRYAAGTGRSKTKRRTVELLKAALKVPRLDAASLNAGGKLAASVMAF